MDNFIATKEPHGYTLNGVPLPSPSSVFEDLGLANPEYYSEDSRRRGHAVHAWIFECLEGRDWTQADPEIKLWVQSGLKLIQRIKPLILDLEVARYHPRYRFAGTLDCRWYLDNNHWIIDWKSVKMGSRAPKIARYQVSAYSILAHEGYDQFGNRAEWMNMTKDRRAVVELQEDGSEAKLIEYSPLEDSADKSIWLSMLTTYKIRQDLRLKQLTDQGEKINVNA